VSGRPVVATRLDPYLVGPYGATKYDVATHVADSPLVNRHFVATSRRFCRHKLVAKAAFGVFATNRWAALQRLGRCGGFILRGRLAATAIFAATAAAAAPRHLVAAKRRTRRYWSVGLATDQYAKPGPPLRGGDNLRLSARLRRRVRRFLLYL